MTQDTTGPSGADSERLITPQQATKGVLAPTLALLVAPGRSRTELSENTSFGVGIIFFIPVSYSGVLRITTTCTCTSKHYITQYCCTAVLCWKNEESTVFSVQGGGILSCVCLCNTAEVLLSVLCSSTLYKPLSILTAPEPRTAVLLYRVSSYSYSTET